MAFVVEFFDGLGPYALEPEAPCPDNTAPTMREATLMFAQRLRESGRQGVPTQPGGPWASVYDTDSWDGISYGDNMLGQFSVGPRGGLTFERV